MANQNVNVLDVQIPGTNKRIRNYIDSKLQVDNGVVQPLTADKFLEIWKYYDRDASRYLERDEIPRFLKDFMNSSLAGSKKFTEIQTQQLVQVFMEEFDENKDGKLSIKELTAILPVEERFFVLFRNHNHGCEELNYMKLWKKYDHDLSGYIETAELKSFLRDLTNAYNKDEPLEDAKLDQYTKIIMKLYDTNGDGKLSISELIRMLPETDNFVKQTLDQAKPLSLLTMADVENILNRYDKNKNGILEADELSSLSLDLLELGHTQRLGYTVDSVKKVARLLTKVCDVDRNGLFDKKILRVVLKAISNNGLESIM